MHNIVYGMDTREAQSIDDIFALHARHAETSDFSSSTPWSPVVDNRSMSMDRKSVITGDFTDIKVHEVGVAQKVSISLDETNGIAPPIHVAGDLDFFNYIELHGGRFKQHQAVGITFMAGRPRTMCGDPVGAGKTIQAAGVIAEMMEIGELIGEPLDRHPVLWLTEGAQLARQTTAELQRFLPRLTIHNLAGHRDLRDGRNEARCRRAVNEPAHVKVMTQTQWRTRGHLWDAEFPMIVLDEVSALKSGGMTYEAVLAATAKAGRVHAFTATIYENDPVEVWHLYSLLHLPGFPTKEQFEREFVQWRSAAGTRRPYAWSSRDMAQRFRRLTAPYSIAREDCIADLQRPRYLGPQYVWEPLSAAQQPAMAEAGRRRGALQRHQAEEAVLAGRGGAQSSRARRAARVVDLIVRHDAMAKILLVTEAMAELDTMAETLSDMGIGFVEIRGATETKVRADVVEAFRNDPSINVLLGSRVVERGLNLQFCRYMISVGLPDNPARLTQAVGRIVRHGSPFDQVEHYVVLNDHDADHRAVERLRRKEEQAAHLHSQVR